MIIAVLALGALSIMLTRPKSTIHEPIEDNPQTDEATPVNKPETKTETLPDISADGECGEDSWWILEENELTISGSGTMEAYKYDFDNDTCDAPWFEYRDAISSVRIQGIVNIGEYSFYRCKNLLTVEISDSVETIGEHAFSNCTAFTDITIPDSVTQIGSYAFSNCTALTGIIIPDSVAQIDTGAFSHCTALTGITIPNGVAEIAWYAFSDCTALTSVTIPDSVLQIGSFAFSNCTALAAIEIPDSVMRIHSQAFSGCSSLESVNVPLRTSLADDAFDDTTAITQEFQSLT